MENIVEIILRLLLAAVLGGLIGAERDFRGKAAGMRTYLLVALGSALMMVISRYAFADAGGDPSRVAAQIVTGIGFIGAGAIMFDKHAVHGLTTAAGIWVVAGIGMAAAAGMYIISIAATLLTLAGLEISGWSFFPRNRRTGEGGEIGNQSPNSHVDK